MWATKDFAPFHHPDRDSVRARRFLDLLLAMKLQLRDIGFVRFNHGPKAGWSRRWRETLGQSKYITFEIRTSQSKDSKASASWLAIEPRFHFRDDPMVLSPGLAGFRYLMVMGYIAFGPLREEPKR